MPFILMKQAFLRYYYYKINRDIKLFRFEKVLWFV